MKLIQYKEADGTTFWVVPAHIVGVEKINDTKTVILLSDGTVKITTESVDSIISNLVSLPD